MAASGTNLELSAIVPPGLTRVNLQMHHGLSAPWQQVAQKPAPAAGGEITFTIPQPATDMAFFRVTAPLQLGKGHTASRQLVIFLPPNHNRPPRLRRLRI